MRRTFLLGSGVLVVGMTAGLLAGWAQPRQSTSQEPQAEEKPIPAEDAAKKNPVKPTPEGLAAAKKLFGYHCAMCHGKDGDGKGDLAADMKLGLKDWRDPKSLEKMSDGELFYIITNGRGKMTGGEGDRTSEEVRWNLVNYVRSFAKKNEGTMKP
ncbi:MAG TPA: c-type cytochrome [Candidatus Eisenbacteria bacterium]|nr:c-type cytochrome [Candidatus Eisenbacteria bacterium]